MKQVAGVWLPDHESHMVGLFEADQKRIDGRATYQRDKLNTALKYCRNSGFAIDVGAHVGMWTLELAKRFRLVMAIEPNGDNFECLQANAGTLENVRLRLAALGDCAGRVHTEVAQGCSGDSFVMPGGEIGMWRLDDLGDMGAVDFVKLDCIGYELPALVGMEQMLRQYRPCVCVEQKPGRAERFGFPQTGAIDYLKSLGAVQRENMSGVYVLSWEG